ncbi:kinesin-like protein KIN-6 isoform X3 [Cucurbita maxima]|uniref:Kinesin-like protein KIN-6 isoform X1 n=1 Tax=Cucurbita maxima TaxID=3661 RepID=A0A6J1KIW8_CUCMA|nr:kinesin-like protein KIN-6 isoform X1 [Cucurbita maxima]XP_023002222.1 kinesin-like protein KIN-6 isoform X2 [Cucurbita maxima]XP_023002223.1 kinesin-like protein KIN-6 isoform X3 [Cucurbita maxima]
MFEDDGEAINRNRKMENGSPVQCPNTVTVRRNPPRRARATPAAKAAESNPPAAISSFPLQEILAMEVPQNPKDNSSSSSSSVQTPLSENLKVYLRVRPLQLKNLKKSRNADDQNSRSGHVWPQNPQKKKVTKEKNVKKKGCDACVTINDDHSVTVCPPMTLQESRRSKSEVYEGFSHVFSTESSQGEVYGKMVSPLVEDFLKGKSGMLTALGPSGSGKTHTIFGSPRDPGMVPLALQHIFRTESSDSQPLRSYYLSIFEIYSEKGKGEKMYDLSADGGELTMQQYTIKGLKEVFISKAGEAESLVACAMTKRATAITNANSTSSRSQCIINIRRVANQDEVEDTLNCAVLTIADLAGAEREKRTGNQGTRLLEANFINNTSMVFGLCLRSLFEHQRNPKKPLQKHFHNSLLTKYLRDYLEGKKRMTLMLTVKAGEEDYLDTTYLLRQASPYMKIKFNNVVEPSNINKRQLQTLFTFEEQKRTKYSVPEACSTEGKGHQEEGPLPHEEPLVKTDCKATKPSHSKMAERNHLIMQNFAKAIWQVLKQYRDKLKSAENENQNLREEIKNEKIRYFELEKQWKNSRCSTCSNSKEDYAEAASIKVVTSFESRSGLDEHRFNGVHETNTNSFIKVKESDGSSPCEDINNFSEPGEVEEAHINRVDETTPRNGCKTVKKFMYEEADDCCLTKNSTAFGTLQSRILVKYDSCSSVELDKFSEQDEESTSPESPSQEMSFIHCDAHECETQSVLDTPLYQPTSEKSERDISALNEDKEFLAKLSDSRHLPPTEDFASSQEQKHNIDVHCSELRADISSKLEKPKRRLLPASSTLLRDFSNMHVEDDIEVSKANRNGKKSAKGEKIRTQGNISLMRMLKGNHLF